jgi:NAD(P)-dependent dehydrogenase (short-subunit alcohol dehydrogenase family)
MADLAQRDQMAGIAEVAKVAFGGVDILVNNAGVSMDTLRSDYWHNPVRYWQEGIDTYRRYFEINVLAAIHLTLLVTPEMQARKWGRIMCVSTSLNTMISGGMAPYGSTKAALESFTASVAADNAKSGITANALAPGGPADTRMIIADIPRDELIPADCLAAPAVWLASDAAAHVTGRRFLGSKWDRTLPPEQAAVAAGAPIAWTGYGVQSYVPKSKPRSE